MSVPTLGDFQKERVVAHSREISKSKPVFNISDVIGAMMKTGLRTIPCRKQIGTFLRLHPDFEQVGCTEFRMRSKAVRQRRSRRCEQ